MIQVLFRALTVLVLVGGLATTAPSAAAASIEAGPASAEGYVTFLARDFRDGEEASTWLTAPDLSVVATPTFKANSRGEIEFQLLMRRYYRAGRWAITIEGLDSDRKAITYFDVVAREPNLQLQVSPPSGRAGSTFFFASTEFRPSEDVGYYVTAPDGATYPGGNTRSTSSGRVDIRYPTVRGLTPGEWIMSAYGTESDNLAIVVFTVTA